MGGEPAASVLSFLAEEGPAAAALLLEEGRDEVEATVSRVGESMLLSAVPLPPSALATRLCRRADPPPPPPPAADAVAPVALLFFLLSPRSSSSGSVQCSCILKHLLHFSGSWSLTRQAILRRRHSEHVLDAYGRGRLDLEPGPPPPLTEEGPPAECGEVPSSEGDIGGLSAVGEADDAMRGIVAEEEEERRISWW